MATKEAKRQIRGVIEGLENRVHLGPPIAAPEIQSVREFLRQNDFSPSSDYYMRLMEIQSRLQTRSRQPALPPAKRNYGGQAGGRFMQVQMVYDHLILSTCYDGEFRTRRGRIKISHRFNLEGRIEFVELKFLISLHPLLDGKTRKLVMVSNYQCLRRDWLEAEAFVLPALPRELMFLYHDVFRCPRSDLFAWLVNIGHGIVEEMLAELKSIPGAAACLYGNRCNGAHLNGANGAHRWADSESGREAGDVIVAAPPGSPDRANGANGHQFQLPAVLEDRSALHMLENIAALECAVEERDPKTVLVRYARRA